MAHALLASARVVQNGKHILLLSSQAIPKSGNICLLTVNCFQIKMACNTDLLTCSKSAVWIGEIFSNGRLPMKNKLYLASLTDEEEYVHQHNKSFNALWTLSRVKHSGSLVRAINVSVRGILPYIPASLVATA